eukprot:g5719.t1
MTPPHGQFQHFQMDRLSVVVTNNSWSDWSTQEWPAHSLSLRIYKIEQSIVVEALMARPDKDKDKSGNGAVQNHGDGKPVGVLDWEFVRIAHLGVSQDKRGREFLAGLYTACPGPKDGGSVAFSDVRLDPDPSFHHSAL